MADETPGGGGFTDPLDAVDGRDPSLTFQAGRGALGVEYSKDDVGTAPWETVTSTDDIGVFTFTNEDGDEVDVVVRNDQAVTVEVYGAGRPGEDPATPPEKPMEAGGSE